MQDLRRVFPEADWLEEEVLHLGDRPKHGYMNHYEWDGEQWAPRRDESQGDLPGEPSLWVGGSCVEDWRALLLRCLRSCSEGAGSMEHKELRARLMGQGIASFSDGLNTGFYINAYTTKHCPSMEGVLEEMRRGLDRMQQSREAARLRYEEDLRARVAGECSSDAQVPAVKRRSAFGATLEVLKRLSASYRRCYWTVSYTHLTLPTKRIV